MGPTPASGANASNASDADSGASLILPASSQTDSGLLLFFTGRIAAPMLRRGSFCARKAHIPQEYIVASSADFLPQLNETSCRRIKSGGCMLAIGTTMGWH